MYAIALGLIGAIVAPGEMPDAPMPNTKAIYAAVKLLGEVAAARGGVG